ncbi:MAG: hypothetical protein IKR74_04040 [Bacilli bacterium]|nr:hypothetical protein [Bacilli bacterium]
MKKVLLTLSSMILLIGALLFLLYPKSKYKEAINYEVTEKIIEEIKEDKEDENITEINEIDNNNVENDISSIHNSNKNDLESNNASNSNVIKNKNKTVKEVKTETSINNTNQELKEEIKEPEVPQKQEEVEPPKVKEEVRDDFVDTNSWFYSIHHGKIETSTQSKCLSAGEEIAFIDTVDINYYRCYEVTSTTGKVLGYYLNIFCNSDNCNRYKNQIDMSKYK